jgi:hypothetical protein
MPARKEQAPAPRQVFLLHIEPHKHGQLRLGLSQRRVDANPAAAGAEAGPQRLSTLWGLPLEVAREDVVLALRKHRLPPSTLRTARKQPVELSEREGVRLGVLFAALKPLRKLKRMEDVRAGVHEMSDEEAAYWFAKLHLSGAERRAGHALRVLLAAE